MYTAAVHQLVIHLSCACDIMHDCSSPLASLIYWQAVQVFSCILPVADNGSTTKDSPFPSVRALYRFIRQIMPGPVGPAYAYQPPKETQQQPSVDACMDIYLNPTCYVGYQGFS